MKIYFAVPGVPVGKGRPKFARRGNFVTTYTPEKTASYENMVKLKAEEAMQGRPVIEGAVSVVIGIHLTPPASWSQKKQRSALMGLIFPTTKPDIDNVVKTLFDACNEIVWRDDKQACDVVVKKRYAVKAEAHVLVETIDSLSSLVEMNQ
ncbi:MAG: RusA family crossover junction endodeoxyribonuclease [Azoarcus sp.]|jgi:Holliday junction resolvase RusA-like endonuclease|nr:RusA family crossover junction endodeoxyribonuclease [Azoarcus sp.]